MVIGPTIGGLLGATGDYYYGARLSVGGSILSIFLCLLLPKDTLPAKPAGTAKATNASQSNSAFSKLSRIIQIVWLILGTKVITGVANAMAASAFPLILKDNYAFDEAEMGYTMSAMSALNAVVNGLLLAPIVAFLGGNLKHVVSVSLICMAVGFAMQAMAGSMPVSASESALDSKYAGYSGIFVFIGSALVLSIFQYLLSTSLTGESTGRVGEDEKGSLLGLEHSLFAAARVVAPQAGVSLWKSGGIFAVSGASSGIFAIVWMCWQAFKDSLPDKETKNGEETKDSYKTFDSERKGK
jgi:hypothetical protein